MRSVDMGAQRWSKVQGPKGLRSANGGSGLLKGGLARVSALKGLLGLSLLLASHQAVAAPAVPQNVPAQAPQTVDAFRQQADKLGVKQCANLFSTIGQVVTMGSTYAVQVQADGKAPNDHAVQGVAGIAYNTPELNGQAAGIVMAAPVGKKCEGQLVRVAPFQKSCAEVIKLFPQGSTAAGTLSGVPLYNLGGNQGQAMMIASGPTCIVVTVARVADAK